MISAASSLPALRTRWGVSRFRLSYKGQFLAAWIALPVLFRLLTLSWLATPSIGFVDKLCGIAWVTLIGIPQDMAVAMQALLIVLCMKGLLARCHLSEARSKSLVACFATGLFLLVHSYMLFDFLLHAQTGLRMDYHFLAFLGESGSMVSSAAALGIWMLPVAFGLLSLVAWQVLRRVHVRADAMQASLSLAFAIALIAMLAIISLQCLPAELAYASNNVVFNEQLNFARDAWWDSQDDRASDHDLGMAWVTPGAEAFERVSTDYPLLKNTQGFSGPRQFELRIESHERPHLVLLFLESFRAADIGVLGGKHPASPNFDRLAREGVLFTRCYAAGIQTTRATIASLFGILPRLSAASEQSTLADMPLIGIADLFNRRGYTSAYFQSGDLAFENQRGFFSQHGYAELHGGEQIGSRFPDAPRTSWGYHDEYLMRYAADWLEHQDRRGNPTCMTMFTITNHHPWQVPPDYRAPRFETGDNSEYRRMLQSFHYADSCLGLFVDLLRQRGLDRRTVLFVLSDTGTPMGEHHDNFMPLNYLYEENVHIPLLILAPGRLAEPVVIDDLASQIDLLPTVMDLFQMTGLNHAMGTSLVRKVPNRTVYFNNPFALQYLGLRQANWKYVHAIRSKSSLLYDLQHDAYEQANLATIHAAQANAYQRRVLGINRLMNHLYAEGKFMPAD